MSPSVLKPLQDALRLHSLASASMLSPEYLAIVLDACASRPCLNS